MIMGTRKWSGCAVVVRPSGTSRETWLVMLVAALTVAICGAVVALRNPMETVTAEPEWRLNAFAELQGGELAVFNALHTAAPELIMAHEEEGNWPEIEALARDFLPPFVRDAAWRRNGQYHWERSIIRTADKHIACYLGRSFDNAARRTFLLVLLHTHGTKDGNAGGMNHAPYEVWVHDATSVGMPAVVSDQTLIGKGWREVIARSGESELIRNKGEGVLK